jgi:DNA-binding PadR family transcriptional regulator
MPERGQLGPAAIHILLAIGPGERHGYAILREVEALTDGRIRLFPGTLYTNLKRLLADGLIEESDQRPHPDVDDLRRRYYRLTPTGRTVIAAEVRGLESLLTRVRPWIRELRG